MLEPGKAGRSEAGFLTKNVSFSLIWFITLCVVFARFNKNKNFFKCDKWSQTMTRYCVFVFLPLAAFLAQLWRTAGVITQVYFTQNYTLDVCASTCILPSVDHINASSHLSCCRPTGLYPNGLDWSDFNVNDCLNLGIDNSTLPEPENIYFIQDPFNINCLVWVDYLVIISSILPIIVCFLFIGWPRVYYSLLFIENIVDYTRQNPIKGSKALRISWPRCSQSLCECSY